MLNVQFCVGSHCPYYHIYIHFQFVFSQVNLVFSRGVYLELIMPEISLFRCCFVGLRVCSGSDAVTLDIYFSFLDRISIRDSGVCTETQYQIYREF